VENEITNKWTKNAGKNVKKYREDFHVQETNKKIIKTKRAKRRTEENKRYCYNSSVNFIAVSGLCEAAECYCQDF
jgi:hypothetical protein